jgi:hypothetical protein
MRRRGGVLRYEWISPSCICQGGTGYEISGEDRCGSHRPLPKDVRLRGKVNEATNCFSWRLGWERKWDLYIQVVYICSLS